MHSDYNESQLTTMGGAEEGYAAAAADFYHHQPPAMASDYFQQPSLAANNGFVADSTTFSSDRRQQRLPVNFYNSNLNLYNYAGESYYPNPDLYYHNRDGSSSQQFSADRLDLDQNLEIEFGRLNLASNPFSAPSPHKGNIYCHRVTCHGHDIWCDQKGAVGWNRRAFRKGYQSPIQAAGQGRAPSGPTSSINEWIFQPLEELRGSIFRVAQDKDGCRFLQRKCDEGKPEDIELMFAELKDHMSKLMVDSSMIHLARKLLKVCSQSHLDQLVSSIATDDNVLKSICLNAHGAREMQKLIENLTTTEQRSSIASAIMRVTVPLITNINGHHVIQHCLMTFPAAVTSAMLRRLAGNYAVLSLNKYGSNVVENCLKNAQEDESSTIIREILQSRSFILVLQHPYGNYVAQSCDHAFVYIWAMQGTLKEILVERIQKEYAILHSHPHGKRVLALARNKPRASAHV